MDLEYLIACQSNNQVLDANVTVARQYDKRHPRIWLNGEMNITSPSQIWRIIQVDKDEQHRPCYLITTNFLMGDKPFALDGNTARHVPQMASRFPSPFLWSMNVKAINHQWLLEPVFTKPGIFAIVNRANGKCLDGNVGICAHADPNRKSPFLSNYRPDLGVPLNQSWELIPVPNHLMSNYPFLQNGIYSIVNINLQQAISPVQYMAVNDLELDHDLIVELHSDPDYRTRWKLELIDDNQYTIEIYTGYNSDHAYLASDNDTYSKLTIKRTQASIFDRQFLWKLLLSEQSDESEENKSFFIINMATGLCLDADDCKITATGFPLLPPSLSNFDYRKKKPFQIWQFRREQNINQ